MEGVTISPSLLGGGTWGCHTLRNKASTWVWCLQTPQRTQLSYRDTRTRTGPRQRSRGTQTGGHGGQEEVGVKALVGQRAEPPRAGAPWTVAKGRFRRALSHRLLPHDTAGGHGGQQGPRVTSPLQHISPRVPRAARRTEKCLEKKPLENPRWPQARPHLPARSISGGPG